MGRPNLRRCLLGTGVLLLAAATAGPTIPPTRIPEPKPAFAPFEYVCRRAAGPIKFDGRLDEPSWADAEWTEVFGYIEGPAKPAPRFRTRAQMLWDDQYLYIGAYLEEPHIWVTLTARDSIIFQDNDFEVFIDPDGDTHTYYELEMTALNTVWPAARSTRPRSSSSTCRRRCGPSGAPRSGCSGKAKGPGRRP